MIAFTICANNYLYKAQVLAASIRATSGLPVYLILADKKKETIDYAGLNFDGVIHAAELGIPNLQWMLEHYDVVEFSTAVKSFAFVYLFKTTAAEHILFFDPDVKVYTPLQKLAAYWDRAAVLLTPHILTPLPFDGRFPGENLFLNHGVYNLGFLGLKRGEITAALLDWWCERMKTHCLISLAYGFFVDQLWFNLVPGLFGATAVIEQPGCNMAYWNLHERKLTRTGSGYLVNDQPLFFYHFSGLDPSLTKICSVPGYRHAFAEEPELKTLYREYAADLETFTPANYRSLQYFDGQYPLVAPKPTLYQRLFRKLKARIS